MLRTLRLMIVNSLLPEGFSIALPGTTILPPLDTPNWPKSGSAQRQKLLERINVRRKD